MESIKNEILSLRKEIEKHAKLYYEQDAPVISDYEYDAMFRRLQDLEAAHPELVQPDTPTQRVGGQAISAFTSVAHPVPLESLQDVF